MGTNGVKNLLVSSNLSAESVSYPSLSRSLRSIIFVSDGLRLSKVSRSNVPESPPNVSKSVLLVFVGSRPNVSKSSLASRPNVSKSSDTSRPNVSKSSDPSRTKVSKS